MRSHAKASTAGSKRRIGKSKPALLLCVLVACVATLALVVGSASGATTRFLVEVFGSSAQPAFPGDRGMAVDQSTGELYVLETNTDEIRRYNSDGTPSNFSALGSNVIDGEGSEDETPDVGLAIAGSRSESEIAIDESGGATDGNIYVTESARDQVSIFNSEGKYLGELNAFETGVFNEPLGVAVDPSGNVYVGDFSSADLIHKYEPAANPPVNGDNSISFASLAGTSSPGTLAAGVGSSAGFIFVNRFNGELFKLDATSGELKYQLTTSASTVWVDPESGHVFVPRLTGSNSEVVEYDASGATEATKVSAFKPGSTVEGVATDDSAAKVYVSRASTENVEVFGPAAVVPDVVTEAPSSNTGVRATLAGTVNPDGVELDECSFEWGQHPSQGGEGIAENTVPCAETPAEIGAGTSPVTVHADLNGLQPSGTRYQFRLVAKNPNGTINGSQLDFTTPDTVITEGASSLTPTEATLNGSVNPDGTAIDECFFEWGPEKGPLEEAQTYPETVACVPSPGSGTSPVAISAALSGLHPGTTYVYRLKAINVNGPILGDSESAQTLGPVIADTWAEDVAITEGTLKAEINPEGSATTYRFEYGKTSAYGSATPEVEAGSDSSTHEVTAFLEALEAGTIYHYRVVATNGVAINEGPDRAIRTFLPQANETDCANQAYRYGPGASLPDCRAYEMVSPLEKAGGDIAALGALEGISSGRARIEQSTPTGGKLTYSAARAFAGSLSAPWSSQYIAQRTASGWETHAINEPREAPIVASILKLSYRGFTEDLCQAWMTNYHEPVLAPGGLPGVVNFYRRNDRLCGPESYEAVAPIATPKTGYLGLELWGISADGSHAMIKATNKLAPEGTEGKEQLYESSAPNTPLRFVCVLPSGEPYAGACSAGSASTSGGEWRQRRVQGAISSDGERIFWKDSGAAEEGRLYARIGGSETVAVSQVAEEAEGADRDSEFWAAAEDGSRVIFTVRAPGNARELYAFDVDDEATVKIADDVLGVAGTSNDAKRVYFASREALDGAAIAGRLNAYLYDEEAGTTRFIATLAEDDIQTPSQGSRVSPFQGFANRRAARVTPDGLHIAFASIASLTGYDNRNTTNGEATPQAFVYDAMSDELTCVSCAPSGARVPDAIDLGVSAAEAPTAVIPLAENSLYASRAFSADGTRLFFEARSPLTPRDTNNQVDVYEWEAEGAGGCNASDSTYVPSARGCVAMLSTGTNETYSRFVDASVDGDDVFINTLSSLVPQDYGLRDVYDARVGGGFPLPPETPECAGDGCQSVPAPPTPSSSASAGFRGAGDPTPRRSCGVTARRALALSRRAKRLRAAAKRSAKPRRAKALRRRSARFGKRAKQLSRNASRCRRANRRASR